MTYAYATVQRGGGCWLLVIPRCPFCSARHVHGAGLVSPAIRSRISARACPTARAAFAELYVLTTDASLHGQPVLEAMPTGEVQ